MVPCVTILSNRFSKRSSNSLTLLFLVCSTLTQGSNKKFLMQMNQINVYRKSNSSSNFMNIHVSSPWVQQLISDMISITFKYYYLLISWQIRELDHHSTLDECDHQQILISRSLTHSHMKNTIQFTVNTIPGKILFPVASITVSNLDVEYFFDISSSLPTSWIIPSLFTITDPFSIIST